MWKGTDFRGGRLFKAAKLIDDSKEYISSINSAEEHTKETTRRREKTNRECFKMAV
jgi:hypothetical protein